MKMNEKLMVHKAAVPLTGVSFCADTVARLQIGKQVKVVPEPSNPHDPNALRVSLLTGESVGYIPARIAQRITAENGQQAYLARVSNLREWDKKTVGADIIVESIIPTTSRLR